jgi:hypothetical protein
MDIYEVERDSLPRAPERSDDNSRYHHWLDVKLDSKLMLGYPTVHRELTSYDEFVFLQALDVFCQRLVVYLCTRFQRR